MVRRGFLSAGVALVLGGCASIGTHPRRHHPDAFDAGDLAKTDIDRAVEVHHREIFATLRVLAEKLYRRNPRQLSTSGSISVETALARLFEDEHGWSFREFGTARGLQLLHLALREDFAGDRVLAFIGGLGGMIQTAFNDRREFFIIDELDAQRLYNSARNVEIAVWKLANRRDIGGAALLLTNDMGPPMNLSFEREFGKIIGSLDILAKLVAEKNRRIVVRVVQSMATAAFLPVK